jgi:hypothetical protein
MGNDRSVLVRHDSHDKFLLHQNHHFRTMDLVEASPTLVQNEMYTTSSVKTVCPIPPTGVHRISLKGK